MEAYRGKRKKRKRIEKWKGALAQMKKSSAQAYDPWPREEWMHIGGQRMRRKRNI